MEITNTGRWTDDEARFIITNCQDKIDNQIDSDQEVWLILKDILRKRYRDVIAVFRAILDGGKEVVVKTNNSIATEKEWRIGQMLQNIPGFVRYGCVFYCNEDYDDLLKENSKYNSTNDEQQYKLERNTLCKSSGKSHGAIIMLYYPEGSLKDSLSTLTKHEKRSIALQILFSMYYAYTKYNIILFDNHSQNILLKRSNRKYVEYFGYIIPIVNYEIRIIDFEKSIVLEQGYFDHFQFHNALYVSLLDIVNIGSVIGNHTNLHPINTMLIIMEYLNQLFYY